MKYLGTRKVVSVAATLAVTASLMSCSDNESAAPDEVDLGLLVPLSGAFKDIGADAKDAFETYLDVHDGQLGGRKVNVVVRDEGDGPETSLPSTEKLIAEDEVDIIAGAVSSANYVGVAPVASEAEVPLIGFGGQPDMTGMGIDFTWLWQSSFTSVQPGKAIAPYIAEHAPGPVYAIGPDYAGGYSVLDSFTEPFLDDGGELANETDRAEWTKWPDTLDWTEYFHKIAESGAKSVFAYYAGAPGIEFVKQYAQSEVKDLPLYGVFLTEGPNLAAEGAAAVGVQTVMNYSPDIDNAANRTFVSEWSGIHPDSQTSLFSMAGWDAALVLDKAISRIPIGEEVTRAKINEAMGSLGTIDSSRGSWQFSADTHTPIQRWYLRTVDSDGPTLANVVIEDLDTVM